MCTGIRKAQECRADNVKSREAKSSFELEERMWWIWIKSNLIKAEYSQNVIKTIEYGNNGFKGIRVITNREGLTLNHYKTKYKSRSIVTRVIKSTLKSSMF